jgi:hypothetical protein
MINSVLFCIAGSIDDDFKHNHYLMSLNNEDGYHSHVKSQRFIMIFLRHTTGYESGLNLVAKADNVIASLKIYLKLKMLCQYIPKEVRPSQNGCLLQFYAGMFTRDYYQYFCCCYSGTHILKFLHGCIIVYHHQHSFLYYHTMMYMVKGVLCYSCFTPAK